MDSFPRYKEEKSYDNFMKCPNCSEKRYTYAETCDKCGAKMEDKSNEIIKQVKVGGSIGLPVAIVAVIVGIAIVVLSNGQASYVTDTLDLLNSY